MENEQRYQKRALTSQRKKSMRWNESSRKDVPRRAWSTSSGGKAIVLSMTPGSQIGPYGTRRRWFLGGRSTRARAQGMDDVISELTYLIRIKGMPGFGQPFFSCYIFLSFFRSFSPSLMSSLFFFLASDLRLNKGINGIPIYRW